MNENKGTNKSSKLTMRNICFMLAFLISIIVIVISVNRIKNEAINQLKQTGNAVQNEVKETGSAVVNKIGEIEIDDVNVQKLVDETAITVESMRERALKFAEERLKKKEEKD